MADNHAVLAISGVSLVVQGINEVTWQSVSTLLTPSSHRTCSKIAENHKITHNDKKASKEQENYFSH